MSALKRFFSVKLQYLGALVNAPPDRLRTLSDELVKSIGEKLGHCKLEVAESAEMLETLLQSKALTPEAQDALYTMISEAAHVQGSSGASEPLGSAQPKFQKLWAAQNYLTEDEIKALANPRVLEDNKLLMLAMRFSSVGLKHGSEKFFQHLAGVYLAMQPNIAGQVSAGSGQTGLRLIQKLKEHFEACECTVTGLKEYPDDPKALKAIRADLFHHAYKQDEPCMGSWTNDEGNQETLNLNTLRLVTHYIPCRCTHRSCHGARSSALAVFGGDRKGSKPASLKKAALQLLLGNDSGSDVDLPGFVDNRSRQRGADSRRLSLPGPEAGGISRKAAVVDVDAQASTPHRLSGGALDGAAPPRESVRAGTLTTPAAATAAEAPAPSAAAGAAAVAGAGAAAPAPKKRTALELLGDMERLLDRNKKAGRELKRERSEHEPSDEEAEDEEAAEERPNKVQARAKGTPKAQSKGSPSSQGKSKGPAKALGDRVLAMARPGAWARGPLVTKEEAKALPRTTYASRAYDRQLKRAKAGGDDADKAKEKARAAAAKAKLQWDQLHH